MDATADRMASLLERRLREAFPDRPVTFGTPPAPVAIFAAAHPEVGDVEVMADGSEAIVVAGHFTHGHFADYRSASDEEAEQNAAEQVVDFLRELFADRIVLWGSHRGGGGWRVRDAMAGADPRFEPTDPAYVWSGPVPPRSATVTS